MIKVMVIDDQKTFLDYISVVLKERFDSEIDISTYGDSALAMDTFEEIDPDIVITDIYMPKVDGFKLITHFKSKKNVPIIALSSSTVGSNSTDSTLTIAMSVGSDYAISKSDLAFKLPEVLSDIIQEID